jgi:hypothetical protein
MIKKKKNILKLAFRYNQRKITKYKNKRKFTNVFCFAFL